MNSRRTIFAALQSMKTGKWGRRSSESDGMSHTREAYCHEKAKEIWE